MHALRILCLTLLGANAWASPITLTPRTAKTASGETVPYEAGVLRVKENRRNPNSRTIEIRFARLRAARPTSVPPIFVLPGGPGVSTLRAFTSANRGLTDLLSLTQAADVVILDQRGFSQTMLVNPRIESAPLDRPDSVQQSIATWKRYAGALGPANPGADLTGYDLTQCAADVDELRVALGYPRISLYGGSFGAQWAFAVMRHRPAVIARAVSSSIEPLDGSLDRPSDLYSILQRIAFEADQDPGLRPYLPPGGLLAAVAAIRDRLTQGPVTVRVDGTTVVLGLADFQGSLVPGSPAAWPAFVLSLYHGRYDAWAREIIAARRSPPFDTPLTLLFDAATGVSPRRLHELATDPANHFLGDWYHAVFAQARSAWPTADLGDAFRTPVVSQIPVVFVSGDWDTSTPIENMLAIAPFYPRGHTIVVHRGLHGSTHQIIREHPEAFAAVLEFYRTGDTTRLPSELTNAAPVFVRPDFPAPAK